MKGLQTKINKLIKAFEIKKKVIIVNSNQNWFSDAGKIVTFYSVVITTPESIEYRRKLRRDKTAIKKVIEKLEDEKYSCFDEEERENIKNEIKLLERKIQGINLDLKFSAPPKWEFSSKVGVLLLLAKQYKELLEELRKDGRT
ncbi:hypothetical protein [Cetobacterium sp.]|uniref:hypothetical protein n=1 Tax=Cetobacterium sp. TaxID=2071632 RepID=UPI002FCA7513